MEETLILQRQDIWGANSFDSSDDPLEGVRFKQKVP